MAGVQNTHDLQVTDQLLIEIGNLRAEDRVFLIAATNHPGNIDPRVLRGGRFSEKLEVGLPGPANRRRLLGRYLAQTKLSVKFDPLVETLDGIAPADIEAICKTARRSAAIRMPDGATELPPLTLDDFTRAIARVNPQRHSPLEAF